MQRAYLGLQGIAAGPIRVGPTGAWLVDSTQTVSRTTTHSLAVLSGPKEEGSTFLPLRAGLASTSDDNGVVTVKYLKNYYPDHSGPSIDLTEYTTIERFNNLYTIIMGSNTEYIGTYSIDVRVTNLENSLASVSQTSQEVSTAMNTVKGQMSSMQQEIYSLGTRIDGLVLNPFADGALLVAGGAK